VRDGGGAMVEKKVRYLLEHNWSWANKRLKRTRKEKGKNLATADRGEKGIERREPGGVCYSVEAREKRM